MTSAQNLRIGHRLREVANWSLSTFKEIIICNLWEFILKIIFTNLIDKDALKLKQLVINIKEIKNKWIYGLKKLLKKQFVEAEDKTNPF